MPAGFDDENQGGVSRSGSQPSMKMHDQKVLHDGAWNGPSSSGDEQMGFMLHDIMSQISYIIISS